MKRVLVITYDWPPRGGERVLRWLKFSKYLPAHGWQPVVYAPENPNPGPIDAALSDDVSSRLQILRGFIPEPGGMMKVLSKFGKKASSMVESHFLVPDDAAPWIDPSVEFLSEFLKHEPVDAIVSTGPPHSCHLIGRRLKKNLQKPWIADFSDTWTDKLVFAETPVAPPIAKKQKALEEAVLAEADLVVLASRSGATRLGIAGADQIRTVHNCFDPDDMGEAAILPSDRFRINYTGDLGPAQNQEVFWEALRALVKGLVGFKTTLEIELVGKVDSSVTAMAIHYGLSENLVQTGSLSHAEGLDRMASAHMLLFTMHRAHRSSGFIPSRLFEYIGTRRPILMIGSPESEAADIIRTAKAGQSIAPDDFHNVKTVINEWYDKFKAGGLPCSVPPPDDYTAPVRTKRYADVLDELQ